MTFGIGIIGDFPENVPLTGPDLAVFVRSATRTVVLLTEAGF